MPECDEESHQPFDRVAAELACQHSGHLGLIDAHEISRGRLGQLPLPDGLVNLNDQAGLDQVFAGVGQAEVREDVSRTDRLRQGQSRQAQLWLDRHWHLVPFVQLHAVQAGGF